MMTNVSAIDVVLPLKIHAREGASDLDRFGKLELPSFDRFFADKDKIRWLLIVPGEDLKVVEERIRDFPQWNIRVLNEDELCPRLKSESGWHKQQILKLAAARVVTSNYYLVLDADVVLKRPARLSDFFSNGKPILQKNVAGAHWDWWLGSKEILASKVQITEDSTVMDVTPEFLHRETCLALQDAIALRNNTDDWDVFLFGSRDKDWTDYTLYWLFVLESGLDHELYDWSAKQMYDGIWEWGQVNRLSRRHLRQIFEPNADSFFFIVQSNIGLDLTFVQNRLSPHLDVVSSGRMKASAKHSLDRLCRHLRSFLPN
ncbi:MAG TPA: DUF6492 family protein [Chthoniobacterales bacterium]|jgi:hypothetical protein